MTILGVFTLEFYSFWIGFLCATIISFLLFRARKRIAEFRDTMSESYRTAVEAMTSTAAQGYRTDLMRWAQSAHLSAHLFALEEILTAPRFLLPPAPIDPSQSAEYDAPALYPFTPEWPQLVEAYGAPTLPLDQILKSKNSLLLIGPPGCGKSVALAAYAIEWLKRTAAQGGSNELAKTVFYANAHDLAFSALSKDVLAPLIPAVQQIASTISASQIPGYLKGSMRSDGCVLLLDAVDELSFPAQEEVRKWLASLIRSFSKTRFIVTIAAEELSYWRSLGFAVASPSPWSKLEKHEFLNRWGNAWQELVSTERKGTESPDSALLIGWINRHTIGLSPFDITMRAWAAFSMDLQGNTPASDQQSYILRYLPSVAGEAVGNVVRTMIAENNSSATRRQVENALAVAWPHAEQSLPPVEDCFDDMVTNGLLRRRATNRFSFCHAVVAARFASIAVAKEENLHAFLSGSLSPLAELTAQAIAGVEDISLLVTSRLTAAAAKDNDEKAEAGVPPIVQEGWRVLSIARWLRDAPATVPWKVEILRRLMKILRTPSQPYPLRVRALCAFLNSGDTSAVQLFRQLLTAPDSDIEARALSAMGLGAMEDSGSLEILTKLLESEVRELRWAAALALGNIASPAAMETLGHTLLSGEDDLRRAVAEALAIDFAEGHAMLKEAILDAEVMVRRAAVFGLAKIAQPWTLEILEKVQVEDAQWAVKSAAGQAVERLHGESNLQISSLPAPSELPWLVAFAAQRKTGLAPGAPAIAMLQKVVREGEVLQRASALQMLGHLGDARYTADLALGMSDSEEIVKNNAFEALWSLENAHSMRKKS